MYFCKKRLHFSHISNLDTLSVWRWIREGVLHPLPDDPLISSKCPSKAWENLKYSFRKSLIKRQTSENIFNVVIKSLIEREIRWQHDNLQRWPLMPSGGFVCWLYNCAPIQLRPPVDSILCGSKSGNRWNRPVKILSWAWDHVLEIKLEKYVLKKGRAQFFFFWPDPSKA